MRLDPWHRWLVLVMMIGVGLSGLLWFGLHDVMAAEPGPVLHGLLVAHGVSAYAAAIGFGSLLSQHVPVGWRQPRNRVTGFLAVGAMVLLVGSALLLYYGGEETQTWARLVHLVAGLGSILVVGLHVIIGRRCRMVRAKGPTSCH